MVSTDPIADMLTRIRNAVAVNKSQILLPHSKIKTQIAYILKDAGFIEAVDVIDENFKYIRITINDESMPSKITEIARLSKPGRRVYKSASDIPTVKGGRGIVVISTSQGIMTGLEAKKRRLGGELICMVY